jgi:hypothetical protein
MTQNTFPRTVLNPPDSYFTKAAEYLIRHSSTWCADFCSDCPRLHVQPASFYDPGDTDCDADLNPLNECCWRHEELFEDEDVCREACEMYAWDMEDEGDEIYADESRGDADDDAA